MSGAALAWCFGASAASAFLLHSVVVYQPCGALDWLILLLCAALRCFALLCAALRAFMSLHVLSCPEPRQPVRFEKAGKGSVVTAEVLWGSPGPEADLVCHKG